MIQGVGPAQQAQCGKTDRFTQAERLLREQGYSFDPVAFRWTRAEQQCGSADLRDADTSGGAKQSASTGPSPAPLYTVREYISQAIAARQPYDRTPRMRIVGSGLGMGAAALSIEFEGVRYFVQITESDVYANAVQAMYGTGDTESAAEHEARETESLAHRIERIDARLNVIVELRNRDVQKVNAMNQQIFETMTKLSAAIGEVRELNRTTNVRVTALEDEHAKTRKIVHDVNTQHGGLSGRVNDLERMALTANRHAGLNVPTRLE